MFGIVRFEDFVLLPQNDKSFSELPFKPKTNLASAVPAAPDFEVRPQKRAPVTYSQLYNNRSKNPTYPALETKSETLSPADEILLLVNVQSENASIARIAVRAGDFWAEVIFFYPFRLINKICS